MSENDWLTALLIIVVLRPPIDMVARALADRIKRGQK